MSSVNYIINDIADRKKDVHNKEKSKRLIASGRIKTYQAAIIAVILFFMSLILAYSLNTAFFVTVLSFFMLSTAYSLFLKNEAFADIITISINFVLRALAGAFVINVWVSPWLIVGTFFLALFLVTGKRRAEISYKSKHRSVLKYYSKELLDALMHLSTTSLLLSYALYSFLGNNKYFIVTFPIALYLILRYLYFIHSSSVIAEKPEKVFLDFRFSLGLLLFVIMVSLIMYQF